MNYEKLEHFVSVARLDRFLTACDGSKTKAKSLYKSNLLVAESFYPIYHLFEIFLRNTINYKLTQKFANPDWIINEKNGFMKHHSLKPSKFYLQKQIINAEQRIKRRGGTITSGRVLAEQSLGFWTNLFDTHYYKLLKGSIINCFPNRPTHIQRKEINIKLHRISEFRNRIYHNEPVCFSGNKIDFKQAKDIKEDIYEVLNWIDTDLPNYVKQFDNIDNNISQALHSLID